MTQIFKSQKTNASITLSSDALSSFEPIKKEVASVLYVALPVPNAPLSLAVDTSDSAGRAVLQYTINNLKPNPNVVVMEVQ